MTTGESSFRRLFDGQRRRFVRQRYEVDIEAEKAVSEPGFLRKPFRLDRATNSVKKRWTKASGSITTFGRNHTRFTRDNLDPHSNFLQVFSLLLAIYVDPLFFFLPVVDADNVCVKIQRSVSIVVTVLRTLTDTLYLIHMAFQFRTGFVAPESQVFGRGELVTDRRQIALRYLKGEFWLDVVAVLPLPQVIVWIIIPRTAWLSSSKEIQAALLWTVYLQYIPRHSRLIPLTAKMVKTSGVIMQTAWAGAIYNLLLYTLFSHILGAGWHLLAIGRQITCWRENCFASDGCQDRFFDCGSLDGGRNVERNAWLNSGPLSEILCGSGSNASGAFNYGLYGDAINFNITSNTNFMDKYLYCLWFGLLNLSSLGQTLKVSTYSWEIIFAILIVILGLLLFALLIGNIQAYLQSLTLRLEEMRLNGRDTEQWMRHRQLPADLRDRVRRYDQYKWVANRGVNEEHLLRSLPRNLRRDIKRHLCFDIVRRVPLFDQMDDLLLDAICEKLRPALHTQDTYIVLEGDPVNEMLFIVRGRLQSETTNGGRMGFFNSGVLGPGSFCGEELLTWALDPKPSKTVPLSTCTVKALCEVEAFALLAEDLKLVATQFRKLHSKHLQHTFRYYSQQWRTWAACFIQSSWRRYQTRKIAEQYWKTWGACFIQGAWRRYIRRKRATRYPPLPPRQGSLHRFGHATILPALALASPALTPGFGSNTPGGKRLDWLRSMQVAEMSPQVPKPSEPDFSVDHD